jgi:hypothetical protein
MPDRTITITEEKLSPQEWAEYEVRRDHFLRNSKWFEEHAAEIGQKYPGKHIVVAGGELFAGDTFNEAREKARLAHPDDKGVYFEYISTDRGPKLYAHLRHLEG